MQQDSKLGFFSISVFLVLIQLFRFQFLMQFNFYSASTLLRKSCFVFFYSVPWEMLYVLRWKVCRFLFVYSFLLISFNDRFVIDKILIYMVYYFDTILKNFLFHCWTFCQQHHVFWFVFGVLECFLRKYVFYFKVYSIA